MHAALLRTTSDFPSDSMLSRWSTIRDFACPYCMEYSNTIYIEHASKTSWFNCHRKFMLPRHRLGATRQILDNVGQWGHNHHAIFLALTFWNRIWMKKLTEVGSEVYNLQNFKKHRWKKSSIFWDLPCWETWLIRHNIDVMHIERLCLKIYLILL